MDVNDPLDFELEDEFLKSPPKVSNKRRKKVIGLDDVLTDLLREQKKLKEEHNEQEKSKTKKAKKDASSYDDDEDPREAYLTELFEKKAFPPLEFPKLGTCNLLQSFLNSELNSVVKLAAEKDDNFLEGLLINGWLPKLAFLCGHIEKTVAIWSFNTMLYSLNEELRNSSSNFWRAVLSSRKEAKTCLLQLINCLSKLVSDLAWENGRPQLLKISRAVCYKAERPPLRIRVPYLRCRCKSTSNAKGAECTCKGTLMLKSV
ncbi:uncharacterized protein [Arachis hypogaea]|uniref:uncharacterized protein n=1 Tax=Arachis hypogaea TaxID=3818 RepID=UPI003B21E610